MANHSVTRRAALGAAAVGVAALEARQAMAQANERKTFVLVHGAWHGGWCWRRAADSLEQRGHKVYAQSLTGKRETIAKRANIRAPKYPQAAFDKARLRRLKRRRADCRRAERRAARDRIVRHRVLPHPALRAS